MKTAMQELIFHIAYMERVNHQVFDYMWKRKMIKISKEQGEMIKAKVRAVFLADSKRPQDMLIDEDTMRQQCKKYSLMMYYNNQL